MTEPDTSNENEESHSNPSDSGGDAGWRETATNAGHGVGRTIGMGVAWPFKAAGLLAWSAGEGVLLGVTRVLPKGSGFWQTWLKVGYKNLKRASGADRINHVMNQGHILHKPIYWNSQKDRWETKNATNWWNGGQQHNYVGPGGVPCSWGAARATELGNQVQSEVAEALELGIERDLYRYANIEVQHMDVDAGGQTGAIADGGQPALSGQVSVSNPGFLEDQLVNTNALFVDDRFDDLAEGRVVSMEAYYETYPETVDSEEMQKQEDRGLLANMQDDDLWKKALYLMALAFAFVLIWEYAPVLLGSGGGGGGGVGGMLPW